MKITLKSAERLAEECVALDVTDLDDIVLAAYIEALTEAVIQSRKASSRADAVIRLLELLKTQTDERDKRRQDNHRS